MKKLFPVFFLILAATFAKAQSFEGTIRWSMQMEITDPATKARMEEAKQKMNDPAEQAKMKAMQEKMNDPNVKAAMEQNPQLKAQMEAMTKMAQTGDMSAMMPKGLVIQIKDKNIKTKMEGGPMAMETLYLNDKNQSYHIDRNAKTYSVIQAHSAPQQTGEKPKVTKTSETKKVLNYNCTKYIVEMQEGPRTLTQTIWATNEIKDLDLQALAKQKMARGQSLVIEGLDGVPLEIDSTMPEGNMTMQVTEIKKESLPSSDFTIPSDYKEVPMMGR